MKQALVKSVIGCACEGSGRILYAKRGFNYTRTQYKSCILTGGGLIKCPSRLFFLDSYVCKAKSVGFILQKACVRVYGTECSFLLFRYHI